jgi:hypothetical protein
MQLWVPEEKVSLEAGTMSFNNTIHSTRVKVIVQISVHPDCRGCCFLCNQPPVGVELVRIFTPDLLDSSSQESENEFCNETGWMGYSPVVSVNSYCYDCSFWNRDLIDDLASSGYDWLEQWDDIVLSGLSKGLECGCVDSQGFLQQIWSEKL